jgi:hypothetical protein
MEDHPAPFTRYLLIGHSSFLPDELTDDMMLLHDGFDPSVIEQMTNVSGELPITADELDVLVLFLCMAPSRQDAERLVADAWSSVGGNSIKVQVLCDSPADMIRTYRTRRMDNGDTVLSGRPIGFLRGSNEGYGSAVAFIRRSVTRKWWQFWR